MIYDDIEFVQISGNLYKESISGLTYRKRLLYNCGWGQEEGYELLPALSFDELISIVIAYNTDNELISERKKFSNLLGAVAVIMQDYQKELLCFLLDKIQTSFFDNQQIKENFQWFCFDEKLAGPKGGIGRKSYEQVLKQYPKWLEISSKVKEWVYK